MFEEVLNGHGELSVELWILCNPVLPWMFNKAQHRAVVLLVSRTNAAHVHQETEVVVILVIIACHLAEAKDLVSAARPAVEVRHFIIYQDNVLHVQVSRCQVLRCFSIVSFTVNRLGKPLVGPLHNAAQQVSFGTLIHHTIDWRIENPPMFSVPAHTPWQALISQWCPDSAEAVCKVCHEQQIQHHHSALFIGGENSKCPGTALRRNKQTSQHFPEPLNTAA
mmetsp:Transcript_79851/g.158190  ORF Transcript_79851/g.158190 Transcript_79851/m.158190 type:complete len:222 (-) Transcript_79851:1141-1806(-)